MSGRERPHDAIGQKSSAPSEAHAVVGSRLHEAVRDELGQRGGGPRWQGGDAEPLAGPDPEEHGLQQT